MTDDRELHVGAIDPPARVLATAAAHGLDAQAILTTRGLRVLASGADNRPAWLDTLIDVRFLAADLAYQAPPQPPTPIRRTWARHYHACVDCGTTSRPHRARGLCSTCYAAPYTEARGGRLDRNPGRRPRRPATREPERAAA